MLLNLRFAIKAICYFNALERGDTISLPFQGFFNRFLTEGAGGRGKRHWNCPSKRVSEPINLFMGFYPLLESSLPLFLFDDKSTLPSVGLDFIASQ